MKIFYHCPVCKQYVKNRDMLPRVKPNGDIQRYHRDCIKTSTPVHEPPAQKFHLTLMISPQNIKSVSNGAYEINLHESAIKAIVDAVIERSFSSSVNSTPQKKLNWFNLSEGDCPKCGENFMNDNTTEIPDGKGDSLLRHPCGFQIRFQRLVELTDQLEAWGKNESKK